MQLAHSANRAFWSPSTPGRRDNKLLLAGVAMVGASVIAVNPVAPALPSVADRAVELSAWEDPFAVWSNTLATTAGNVAARGSDLATIAFPAFVANNTSPDLYAELFGILFNPVPGLTQFFTDLPGYAEIVNSGLAEASAGLTEHFDELPATLQSAWDNMLAGQFTQAFADVVSWGIFGLGEAGWPLFPAFEIPGDIARGFGAEKIAEVLDLVFVGDGNAATGYAYSLLSPPITAAYQMTDILNVISGSLYEGDWETALSEIVNAPAKVLDAFLNGYQPSVAAEWETFPGLFSEDGPIDTFFVKLPTAIAEIFAENEESEEAETADTGTTDVTLASVTSTEQPNGNLLTVDVPAGEEAPATDDEATEDEVTEGEDAVTEGEDAVTEIEEATDDEAIEDVVTEDAEDEATDDEGTLESEEATDDEDTLESEQNDEASDEGEASDTDASDDSDDSDSDSDDDDSESGSDSSDPDSDSDSGDSSDD